VGGGGGGGGGGEGEGRGMGTTSFWTLPPPLTVAIYTVSKKQTAGINMT